MSNWISIEDSFPDANITINAVVYSYYKNKSFVCSLYIDSEEGYLDNFGEKLDMEYAVTHWMPLPELPEK